MYNTPFARAYPGQSPECRQRATPEATYDRRNERPNFPQIYGDSAQLPHWYSTGLS